MRPTTRDQLSSVCSDESDEPSYRYSYTRTRACGLGRATVILHNPVHRGDRTDPTTGRCMTWLCSDGEIGEVVFVNLFAYRHRDPLTLAPLADAGVNVVGPLNDAFIINAITKSDLVVVAWGANPPRIDPKRASEVMSWVKRPHCFGTNAGGSPMHPNRRGSDANLRHQAYFGTG
jgi:hypothetical protein